MAYRCRGHHASHTTERSTNAPISQTESATTTIGRKTITTGHNHHDRSVRRSYIVSRPNVQVLALHARSNKREQVGSRTAGFGATASDDGGSHEGARDARIGDGHLAAAT
jgi:hypothetical protein